MRMNVEEMRFMCFRMSFCCCCLYMNCAQRVHVYVCSNYCAHGSCSLQSAIEGDLFSLKRIL